MINRRTVVKGALAAPFILHSPYVLAQQRASTIDGVADIERLRRALGMREVGSQEDIIAQGGTAQSPSGELRVTSDYMGSRGGFGRSSYRARSDAAPIIESQSTSTYIRYGSRGNYCGPLMTNGRAMTLVEGPNMTVFSMVVAYLRSNTGLTQERAQASCWPIRGLPPTGNDRFAVQPDLRARALIWRAGVKRIDGHWQNRDLFYCRDAVISMEFQHEDGDATGVTLVDIQRHTETAPSFQAQFTFQFS